MGLEYLVAGMKNKRIEVDNNVFYAYTCWYGAI